MKKLLTLLLSALCAWTLTALTATVNGITWNYEVSNGEAKIYKNTYSPAIPSSTSGAITIPSTLGGYPVTSIGDYAFRSCSGLTSVTIPSSVTSIGYEAFYNCESLTSITIPSSVTSIGEEAFSECSGLTSVVIPEGVTSIGDGAFSWCKSLTSVTITEGVTEIGKMAFYNCSSLTSVTIPSSVTSIGDRVFEECRGLYKDANGVQYESEAKVVLIDVPTSVSGSFEIPSSVRFIHSEAFYGCSRLTSVTIPEGVTAIGNEAFGECTSLTSVTFPSTLMKIGGNAFQGCSLRGTVTLPASLRILGVGAFGGCCLVREFEFLGPPPKGDYSPFVLLMMYIPIYAKGTYTKAHAGAWQEEIVSGHWKGIEMSMNVQQP